LTPDEKKNAKYVLDRQASTYSVEYLKALENAMFRTKTCSQSACVLIISIMAVHHRKILIKQYTYQKRSEQCKRELYYAKLLPDAITEDTTRVAIHGIAAPLEGN
jgi:hypothetical protein